MITIGFKSRFSAKPVITAAEKMQRRVLFQFGAYVRRVAMSSIQKGDPHQFSQPGQPPIGHEGNLRLKDLIRFAYDEKSHAVYIGCVLANGTHLQSPAIIEYGGDEEVTFTDARTGSSLTVTVHYEARPFMRPAFDKARDKFLQELLRNSIVKE